MTTPKELADKAKKLAAEPNRYNTLCATIDQLQAMAEARQGSGEPVNAYTAWSAHSALNHLSLYNGPGRLAEATAMLVPAPPSAQQATDAYDPENDPPACEPSDWSPPAGWDGDGSVAAMARRAAQQATGSGQVLTENSALETLIVLAKFLGINEAEEKARPSYDGSAPVSRTFMAAIERFAAATQAQPEAPDFPAGAIVNGNIHADRVEATGFECEGGNLPLCADWQEFRRCFNHLAHWAELHAAPTTGKREPLRADVALDMAEPLRPLFKSAEDWLMVLAYARAIEQAHGITGEQR
jgi:hypothetical protein